MKACASRLRLVIGDRDETFENNRDFHLYLGSLGIPHDWIVLPGVGHDPFQVLTALGDRQWAFLPRGVRVGGRRCVR